MLRIVKKASRAKEVKKVSNEERMSLHLLSFGAIIDPSVLTPGVIKAINKEN